MKITLETLKAVCDGYRKDIDKPFKRNGYIYATNGKAVVRIPESAELATDIENKINIEQFEWNIIPKTFIPVPEVNLKDFQEKCTSCNGTGQVSKCTACDGDGEHECTCGDFHTCRICDGKGILPLGEGENIKCENCNNGIADNHDKNVIIGDNRFAQWLVYAIFQAVGQFEIMYGQSRREPNYFRFEGGDGFIMPLRWQI